MRLCFRGDVQGGFPLHLGNRKEGRVVVIYPGFKLDN